MSRRFPHLDFIRGISALLVVSQHVRAYLFVNYEQIDNAGLGTKIFYFVTGLGHQAVIVFFALSGFLVGSKALENIVKEKFSWLYYMARRLTRLWVVMIPALLLTLMFDTIGQHLTNGVGYDGRYHNVYVSGPTIPGGISLSFSTFVANLLFLQTIAADTYGSNGPLWSLANEFWYYLIFPLAAWIFFRRKISFELLWGLLALTLMCLLLPMQLLEGGIVWCAGAAAGFFVYSESFFKLFNNNFVRLALLSAACAVVIASKIPGYAISDLYIGLSVACILPILAFMPDFGRKYNVFTRYISEISYTLYLNHFSLLTLIVMTLFAPARMTGNIFAFAVYFAIIGILIAWCTLLWHLLERHTDAIFFWVRSGLSSKPAELRD